jgi:hypothetical protein
MGRTLIEFSSCRREPEHKYRYEAAAIETVSEQADDSVQPRRFWDEHTVRLHKL